MTIDALLLCMYTRICAYSERRFDSITLHGSHLRFVNRVGRIRGSLSSSVGGDADDVVVASVSPSRGGSNEITVDVDSAVPGFLTRSAPISYATFIIAVGLICMSRARSKISQFV